LIYFSADKHAREVVPVAPSWSGTEPGNWHGFPIDIFLTQMKMACVSA